MLCVNSLDLFFQSLPEQNAIWYLHLVAISVNLIMTCLGLPVLPNDMIDALIPPGPLIFNSMCYLTNRQPDSIMEGGIFLCLQDVMTEIRLGTHLCCLHTVEQEIFVTGNFREFGP